MKHIRILKIEIKFDENKISKKTIIEWLNDFVGIEKIIEIQ